MKSKYETKMGEAQDLVNEIEMFRAQTTIRILHSENFLTKANRESLELSQKFRDIFEIYRQYKKPDEAKNVLDMLFEFLDSTGEFVTSFRFHLLLSTIESIDWLEKQFEGTKAKVRDHLKFAYRGKLNEIEMGFGILTSIAEDRQINSTRSVLGYLKHLVETDQERAGVDMTIMKSAELAALFCLARGSNLDVAEQWYRQAAAIANLRLNDQSSSSYFLEIASRIKYRSSNPPYQNPAFVETIKSQPGTQEYANAMHRTLSITDDLTVMVRDNLEASLLQTFLLSSKEIVLEYEDVDDKLDTLLKDSRLVINRTEFETKIAQELSGKMGILERTGQGQYVDLHGNPRSKYGITEWFICQYVREVTGIVDTLFQIWQDSGQLSASVILARICKALPDYDLEIVKNGLESYCDGNLIAATHTLIPQFENILRQWAKLKGAKTKKHNRQNIPGEKLLHDFINPSNTEIQTLLGGELYELIAWLMVNDGPFDYRNKLAHGWLTAQECDTEGVSSITIFLIMKIMAI